MEPVSTFFAGYATDKLTEIAEHLVRKHVIERWTRKRAVEFYRTFCAALLSENPDERELGEMLDELLKDDIRSEVVFEAYRLVCLAKSKTIGPRIIAILVAEIVQRDGVADDEEEALLAAAERLSDSELTSFAVRIAELPEPDSWGDIEVELDKRTIDSNYPDDEAVTGAGSLFHALGSWAEPLRSLGFLSDSVSESTLHYQEDSERHIDMDGTVREFKWSTLFHSPSSRLAKLVERVSHQKDQ